MRIFYEESKDGQDIVLIVDRKEARVLVEAVEIAALAVKQRKNLRKLADQLAEQLPCF